MLLKRRRMICVFLLFQLCLNIGDNFLIAEISQIRYINFDELSHFIKITHFTILNPLLITSKAEGAGNIFICQIMIIDDMYKMS